MKTMTAQRALPGMLLAAIFCCTLLTFAPALLVAQDSESAPGVPDDWTHHRVVFSDPGSVSQAAVQGRIDQWKQTIEDPRYKIQQRKRFMMQRGAPAPAVDFATLAARLSQQAQQRLPAPSRPRIRNTGIWSMMMGGDAAQTGTITSNNATSSSSVTVDGQTLSASAPTKASQTGSFSGNPTAGQTVTIAGTLVLTASTSSNTGTNFQISGTGHTSTTNHATDLAAAIARNGAGVGVTASSSVAQVTVTAVTAGTTANSITVADGLSNFSWTGSFLAGGADGTQSGTTWAYWSGNAAISTSDLATNITATINANSTLQTVSTGVLASASANVITVKARTAGTAANSFGTTATSFTGITWGGATLAGGQAPAYTPDVFPAKYSFDSGTTAGNCDSAAHPDYVVYPTGLTGGTSQPNIIAYDNVYASCSTTTVPFPNVFWQFNTGGLVTTSPVLSLDGTQVAYVQLSGGAAQLVLLKWNQNSALQSPTVQASAANYNTCSTKPCWYAITFAQTAKFNGGTGGTSTKTTPTDTYSSPYYDYANDALYVGEDNGYLHKFSPVFKGAPAEVVSNWPVQVAVAPLNSPVLDGATQVIYDAGAVFASNSSAFYHSIPAAGGTATALHTSLAATGTDGNPMFFDGALLDPSTQKLYAFVNDDGAGTPSAAVWQLNEALTTATEAKIGQGADAAGTPIYTGQFDNIYQTGSTGNIYVCGRAAASQASALWRVNVNGTTLTPTAIDTLTTAAAQCSPVTEFFNGSTDHIYLSVAGSSQTASPISCPSNTTGCLMSFTVTTALAAGASTTSRVSAAGGTGGIVIDNQSATSGNSQIYFYPKAGGACAGNSNSTAGVGTGPCAYQLSQFGLN